MYKSWGQRVEFLQYQVGDVDLDFILHMYHSGYAALCCSNKQFTNCNDLLAAHKVYFLPMSHIQCKSQKGSVSCHHLGIPGRETSSWWFIYNDYVIGLWKSLLSKDSALYHFHSCAQTEAIHMTTPTFKAGGKEQLLSSFWKIKSKNYQVKSSNDYFNREQRVACKVLLKIENQKHMAANIDKVWRSA